MYTLCISRCSDKDFAFEQFVGVDTSPGRFDGCERGEDGGGLSRGEREGGGKRRGVVRSCCGEGRDCEGWCWAWLGASGREALVVIWEIGIG